MSDNKTFELIYWDRSEMVNAFGLSNNRLKPIKSKENEEKMGVVNITGFCR